MNYLKYLNDNRKDILNNDICLIFEGELSFQLITEITDKVECKINESNASRMTGKKVFNVLVESLQNIYYHGSLKNEDKLIEPGSGIIIIHFDKDYFYIDTGNLIKNKYVAQIKDSIDEINKFSKKETRELFKKQLDKGRISAKGGAGLGFIDMSRKTNNKIDYNFVKIDNVKSFFGLTLKIDRV